MASECDPVKEGEGGSDQAKDHNSSSSSSPLLPSTYTLKITLVRARKLRAADLNGSSDPYAKLFYTEPNARGMESAAGTDGAVSRKEGLTRSIGDFGRGMLHQSMRVVGGTIDAVNSVGGAIGTAARVSMDALRIHPGMSQPHSTGARPPWQAADATPRRSGSLSLFSRYWQQQQRRYRSLPVGRIQFGETSCIKNTLSPEWNQDFILELPADDHGNLGLAFSTLYFVIEVYDRDALSTDDLLGKCRLHLPTTAIDPINGNTNVAATETWCPLVAPANASGEVLVRLQWDGPAPTVPASIAARTPMVDPTRPYAVLDCHLHASAFFTAPGDAAPTDAALCRRLPYEGVPEDVCAQLFRTACPPTLPIYAELYSTVRITGCANEAGAGGRGVSVELPPANEVLLDIIDDVIFNHEMGTLYLTNYRLVVVPYELVESHVWSEDTDPMLQQAEKWRHRLLVLPLGCMASTTMSTKGPYACMEIEAKAARRYTIVKILDAPDAASLDDTRATSTGSGGGGGASSGSAGQGFEFRRVCEEILWRQAEGPSAFSVCEHVVRTVRKLNTRPKKSASPGSNVDAGVGAADGRANAAGTGGGLVPVQTQPLVGGAGHNMRRALLLQSVKGSTSNAVGWRILADFRRMGVLTHPQWAYTTANHAYALCPTYTRHLVVPAGMPPDQLPRAAELRSKGRLPVLTWLHPTTGAPLCRCAQPKAGVTGKTLREDNALLLAIRAAATHADAVLEIFDARPRLNANANALAGKGFESVSHLGGASVAHLAFCNIGNIHVMRASLAAVVRACTSQATLAGLATSTASDTSSSSAGSKAAGTTSSAFDFWSQIAASKWLDHVLLVLKGSLAVADRLEAGSPCVVHCSDGWDRTRTGVDLGTSLPTGAARSARRSRKTSRRPYSCSGSTACTKSCTSTPPSLTSPPTSSCFSQTRRCSRDISARFCATRRRSGVTSASCTVCAAVAVMLCAHRSLREVLRGGRGADPHRVAIAGRTPCLCGTTWRRTARASPTRSTPPPRATASCSTSRSTRRPWCCGVPCTSASPCMTAAWPRACRATAAPRPHRPRAPPIPRSTACFPRSTRRGLPPCPVRAQSYPRTSA
eukprot:m.1381299 g.1381299  ORF g.1381299 m.1381299 type:complete len:1103 (+) comp24970_c0_seq24:2637-5945(+)